MSAGIRLRSSLIHRCRLPQEGQQASFRFRTVDHTHPVLTFIDRASGVDGRSEAIRWLVFCHFSTLSSSGRMQTLAVRCPNLPHRFSLKAVMFAFAVTSKLTVVVKIFNTEHRSAGAAGSSAPKHATRTTVTETFLAEQSHVAQTAKLRNVVMTVLQRPMGRGQAGV